MSEMSKYEAYKKKLQGLCDEHNMIFRLRKDKYPFTLTIRPAGGMDNQMSLLEREDKDNFTSPDASITFTMRDGAMSIRLSKTFTIDEALFGRFKALFKNLYATWTGYFFQDVTERDLLRGRAAPVIDETEDDEGDDEFSEDNANEDGQEPDDDDGDLDDGEDGQDGGEATDDGAGTPADETEVEEATRLVRQANKASVSFLQRAMKIGYAKAARIMDTLEERGVVGLFNGSAREVLPYDEPDDAEIPELGSNAEEGESDGAEA